MTLGGWIFLIVLALLVWFAVATYNRLVSLSERSSEAWSDIDVQLRRRTDLVPNLVETVKGYASHERQAFDEVTRWRSAALSAGSPQARALAENQLSQALRGLFAVAEAYPELKANQGFQQLQSNLSVVEDAVQNARRYYNAVVRDLNIAINSFPSNFVASTFQFKHREFFELDLPEERQVPSVSFGT